MTKTRFIGDVHGLRHELTFILRNLPEDVTSAIQIGDMGVGFGQSDYWHESLEDMLEAANCRFIRGNHDNPFECRRMRTCIKDGLVEDGTMFVGGAWSIDNPAAPPGWHRRTLGIDWWPEEQLSHAQLTQLSFLYGMVKPRVMVTHDIPQSVSDKLFFGEGRILEGRPQYNTRTGVAFDSMFGVHKPKLWVFGHWHHDIDEVIDGTRFICLNELSYIDVDMETLEVSRGA
jgi:hypothetical protein